MGTHHCQPEILYVWTAVGLWKWTHDPYDIAAPIYTNIHIFQNSRNLTLLSWTESTTKNCGCTLFIWSGYIMFYHIMIMWSNLFDCLFPLAFRMRHTYYFGNISKKERDEQIVAFFCFLQLSYLSINPSFVQNAFQMSIRLAACSWSRGRSTGPF